MENFSNLTIGKLLKTLQLLTRQNAMLIKQNNEVAERLKNDSGSIETHRQIDELYRQNSEYTNENMDYIAMHSSLLSFYREFGNIIETALRNEEKHVFNAGQVHAGTEDFKKSSASENTSLDNSDAKKESLNLAKLKELLAKYIAEERYEECIEVQKRIASEINSFNE